MRETTLGSASANEAFHILSLLYCGAPKKFTAGYSANANIVSLQAHLPAYSNFVIFSR